ncbi:MAG: hypothetical protein WC390_07240 [Sulfurimonas sp.]|jgi:hypothetical protein
MIKQVISNEIADVFISKYGLKEIINKDIPNDTIIEKKLKISDRYDLIITVEQVNDTTFRITIVIYDNLKKDNFLFLNLNFVTNVIKKGLISILTNFFVRIIINRMFKKLRNNEY